MGLALSMTRMKGSCERLQAGALHFVDMGTPLQQVWTRHPCILCILGTPHACHTFCALWLLYSWIALYLTRVLTFDLPPLSPRISLHTLCSPGVDWASLCSMASCMLLVSACLSWGQFEAVDAGGELAEEICGTVEKYNPGLGVWEATPEGSLGLG